MHQTIVTSGKGREGEGRGGKGREGEGRGGKGREGEGRGGKGREGEGRGGKGREGEKIFFVFVFVFELMIFARFLCFGAKNLTLIYLAQVL